MTSATRAEYVGYIVNLLPDNTDGTIQYAFTLFYDKSFDSMRRFLRNRAAAERRKGGRWTWRIKAANEYFFTK